MTVRARDLGLPFQGETGEQNAITDVPGVEVGFTTIIEGEGPVSVGAGPIRTGVTAILPRGRRESPRYVWAGHHSFNGNGEMTGTHWIDEAGCFLSPICITNTHAIGIAHHATVKWMIDHYREHYQEGHAWAMPVVAETYDGLLNDICGLHVKEEHVLAALNSAASGPVAEGNVGGGTGMISYEFKAGTGTSSRRFTIGETDYTIGVLVQSNLGARHDFTVLGVPVGKELQEGKVFEQARRQEMGSIIVVIGTDIPLNPLQLRRIAKRATLGMARTGTSGGHGSGDIFLAFSTANESGPSGAGGKSPDIYRFDVLNEDLHIDTVYRHAVHAVEEAIINAVVAGRSLSAVKPAGFDVPELDHDALRAVMRRSNRLEE
jgi:D-aminopeptidase